MSVPQIKRAWAHMKDITASFPEACTSALYDKMALVEYAQRYTLPHEFELAQYDAIMLIDVQSRYCDPIQGRGNEGTEKTAKHIAALTPLFRQAGLPIYSIYYHHKKLPKHISTPDDIDFYEYKPEPSDILHGKTHNSAFECQRAPELIKILKENNHKNILAMGFNAGACFADTLLGGSKTGLRFTVIADGIDSMNGWTKRTQETLEFLFNRFCIPSITSQQALDAVRYKSVTLPAPKTKRDDPMISFVAI